MAVPSPELPAAPHWPPANSPICTARERSGSLTGYARQAPSLAPSVPCSAPFGALRRDFKGMLAPIGPLRVGFRPMAPPHVRSALPSARRRSGASPAAFGVTSGQERFPSLPAWLGLPPPALARHSAAAPAPHRLRTGLRPGSGPDGALDPAARPWAAPDGPADRLARRCGLTSGSSAPHRGGPPQGGPARALPSLVPRSVGRLGGLRAPLLPPGAWSGPFRAAFYGPRPRAFLGYQNTGWGK